VVEDNALTRQIVRLTLEKRGFRVVEARDGQSAVTALLTERPDVILQDLHLPDIDGIELVQRLREMPAGRSVPILAFSGLLSKLEEARAMRAGFTDYLFKPVQPARLIEAVQGYLEPRRPTEGRPGRNRRLLLVDDDPLQLELNQLQLEELGFVVDVANSGADALTAARMRTPSVIVTDLLMPGMSGLELCLAVRRDAGLMRTPVVISTSTFAIVDEADRKLAEKMGADAFVMRTPGLSEVIQAVLSTLDQKHDAPPVADADSLNSEYARRLMRQLEHQAVLNSKLARRGAMDTALLSIMTGAAQILTRSLDLTQLMRDVLARALDAGGVSAGAIFLADNGDPLRVASQIGFDDGPASELPGFFGHAGLLESLARHEEPTAIPSPAVPLDVSTDLLRRARCAAIVLAPMRSGGTSHGALLILSSVREVDEGWLLSLGAVASQLGQAVALSRTVSRLTESEARFRSLFEGIPVGVWRSTPQGQFLAANPEFLAFHRVATLAEMQRRTHTEMYVDPNQRDEWRQLLERDGEVRNYELRVRRADGTVAWASITVRETRGHDGRAAYHEGSVVDITERKLAQATLSAAEERLQRVMASSNAVIYVLDLGGTIPAQSWVSENITRITGHALVDAMHPEWFPAHVHPDERAMALSLDPVTFVDDARTREFRFRCADGRYIWMRDSQRLVRNADGEVGELVGAWVDINERKALETQLAQSHKMEAIGQLAAGVAHDFNNMLTAIAGYAELLGMDLPPEDRGQENVAEILRASERAGTLTRQLLAFGRRQRLKPEVISLGTVVQQIDKMLGRLIGEHIEIATLLDDSEPNVKIDPGQLEQVVLNLAINARDAMERGGKLTIETRAVEMDAAAAAAHGLGQPGRYASLLVSDTGSGMTPDTLAHMFEPFFTTKEQGRGTGLGLSTVYGIVKQSGGSIMAYSELGVGTTFKLYFPGTEESQAGAVSPIAVASPRGNATVLLVEDEEAVRRFAAEVLTRHGYRVLPAAHAEDAIRIAAAEPTIDILLTDVVMPGLSGPDLAHQLIAARPQMRVMFMSGYAGGAVVRHGMIAPGSAFLDKPFTAASLLDRISSVLRSAP
jgi:PAS domain S-box-containing protein